MYLTQDKTSQIDDILNRIGEKLQLDETRRKKAESAYNAVADELENDESFFRQFKLEVYPHGSFRLGTAIKPYKGEEYDLDFIAHANINWNTYSPIKILDSLEKCLRSSQVYKLMVERKNRCVRINYSGDFHLDIQPGCPLKNFQDDNLKVPDRESKSWMDSNPRGFAKWFESKYLAPELIQRRYEDILTEWRKLTEKEPVPQSVPYHMMQPIQRAVQLIKRFRDVYFFEKDQPDLKPSSIILTTLAGYHYNNELSEFETIKRIVHSINYNLTTYGNSFQVVNPVNTNERFTDKWDNEPKLRKAFNEFIQGFATVLNEIEYSSNFINKAELLKKLLGSSITDDVLIEQANHLSSIRNISALGITTTGIITANQSLITSPIKRNTFYGR